MVLKDLLIRSKQIAGTINLFRYEYTQQNEQGQYTWVLRLQKK